MNALDNSDGEKDIHQSENYGHECFLSVVFMIMFDVIKETPWSSIRENRRLCPYSNTDLPSL